MSRPPAFAALFALLAACQPGRGAPSVTPVPPTDACVLLAGRGADSAVVPALRSHSDPTVIALAQPVEPAHAPEPRREDERLVFRHLYETLVYVDCEGRVAAGLAAAWQREVDGRAWRFTLRSDARFWDGAPVTADDVAAAWAARADQGATAGALDLARVVPESMSVVSDRIIIVTLDEALADTHPRAFAHPSLAVTKPSSATPWPIGTGAYWPVDEGSRGTIVVARPVAGRNGPAIHFVGPIADPRDVLDRGADLLVTDDRATLAYGATLPDYVATPLPWDRTYVLALSPAGTPAADVSEGARDALARDAVRRAARGAEPPFWWHEPPNCAGAGRRDPSAVAPGAAAPPTAPAPMARIVYRRDDATAGELAERLVALARHDPGESLVTPVLEGPLVAAGLDRDPFAAALAAGRDPAYILSLPGRPLAPCAALARLRSLVPWLAAGERGALPLVALVDTRRHALVRTGAPPMRIEWDGTPVVGRARRWKNMGKGEGGRGKGW